MDGEGKMKPVILVTRKLPEAVEDRLRRDYQPILNPTDTLYSSADIINMAAEADAILPCHTEKFSAEVIERLPARIKAIANFSVGYDHVDVMAAKKRGLIVTNTPDVLSDATAELTMMLMLGAARRASETRAEPKRILIETSMSRTRRSYCSKTVACVPPSRVDVVRRANTDSIRDRPSSSSANGRVSEIRT